MEMRPACEKCGAPTPPAGVAYVCSHECTWCADCAFGFAMICPNCQGELTRRPRRRAAPGA